MPPNHAKSVHILPCVSGASAIRFERRWPFSVHISMTCRVGSDSGTFSSTSTNNLLPDGEGTRALILADSSIGAVTMDVSPLTRMLYRNWRLEFVSMSLTERVAIPGGQKIAVTLKVKGMPALPHL